MRIRSVRVSLTLGARARTAPAEQDNQLPGSGRLPRIDRALDVHTETRQIVKARRCWNQCSRAGRVAIARKGSREELASKSRPLDPSAAQELLGELRVQDHLERAESGQRGFQASLVAAITRTGHVDQIEPFTTRV